VDAAFRKICLNETPTRPAAADPQGHVLRRRARVALAILAGRTVVLQLTTLAGQVALARYLEPRDFGVYAVIRFALTFFTFFGDVGLGGGLVQKKDAPTELEVSSVFTLQLLLSTGIVAVIWAVAGLVDHVWTDLPTSGPWLLRILALDLLLTSLRTIPSILMERGLQFIKLAALDVTLGLAFYVTAITLARLDFGSNALVIAVVVQGTLGAALAFALHPFRPRLVLSRAALRPLVKFGIPFQLVQVIGFLNGAVTPIYAGAALGVRSLGLINWAQDTGYFPLKAVEIVGRVGFPLYSRLQSDPRALGESFGRAVHLCAIATAFFVGLAFSMGANVIHVVFTDKWMPALPLLYIYAGAISIGFYTPLIGAALNGTGRPGLLLRLSCVWVALAWIVVPFTTPRWGVQGYAYGYCFHVIFGNLLMLALTPRLLPHARLLRRFMGPICGGVLVYLAGHYYLSRWASTPWRFVAAVGALVLLHLGFLLVVDYRGVRSSLSLLPKDSELA
jgi:O-antigen/teichoic acid export membrane protein